MKRQLIYTLWLVLTGSQAIAQTEPKNPLSFKAIDTSSRFYTKQTTSTRIQVGAMIQFGAMPIAWSIGQPATEKADKRLADLLAPGSGVQAASFSTKPKAWPSSITLDVFVLPVTRFVGAPVRLPLPAGAIVLPRSAPEGTPLVTFREESKAPKQVEFPTQPLIRLPSVDVTTPLPIPILGQPVKDRASLGEPALFASIAAALDAFTPARDRPVPFMPINLPDPFEHIRFGQVRNPPEESATPPAIPWTMPTK